MTEEMAYTAGKVISVRRHSGRQTVRNNAEADTTETILATLSISRPPSQRSSAIIGKAVVGLKLLSTNVGKLTYPNITDLQDVAVTCHP